MLSVFCAVLNKADRTLYCVTLILIYIHAEYSGAESSYAACI
jgi:hypothetical protein